MDKSVIHFKYEFLSIFINVSIKFVTLQYQNVFLT